MATSLISSLVIFICCSQSRLYSTFEQDTTIYNNYVGASYTIEGNRYEETLLYFTNPDQVGKKVKSLLEIQNDTLIKTFPLDDNWNIIESGYSIEKFIRLD